MTKNVWKIIALRALMMAAIMSELPVAVPFWEAFGMTSADIVWLNAILLIVICCFEIPSGIIADRIGRRNTIIMGGVFMILCPGIYLLSSSLIPFLVAESSLAIGISLVTGTDHAILWESLQKTKREIDFPKFFGRLRAAEVLVGAVLAFFAGHTFAAWVRLPYVLCLLFFLGFVALASTIQETKQKSVGANFASELGEMFAAFRGMGSTIWLVAFAATAYGVAPILKTFVQVFFKHSNVPVEAFGYAPSIGMICGAALALVAYRIERRLGETRSLLIVASIATSAFLLLSVCPGWMGFIVTAMFMTNEVWGTITLSKYINAEIPNDIRATTMSIVGMGSRVCSLGLLFFFRDTEGTALAWGFALSGMLALLAFSTFGLFRYRARRLAPTCEVVS